MLNAYLLWLVAFALGLLLLAAALVKLWLGSAAPPGCGPRWLPRVWTGAAVALISLTGADLLLPLYDPPQRNDWIPLLLVTFQFGLVGLCLGAASVAFRRAAVTMLLLLATASTVQASRRFYQLTGPDDQDLTALLAVERTFSELDFVELPQPVAYTDAGQPIPLFIPREDEYDSEDIERSTADVFEKRVIELTPPDPASNCHGWAFTGGRFAVRGRDVLPILKDNGYDPIELPAPGDLIIYRDPFGEVTHTGVVKAVGDSYVLIESKWGVLGVFLHAPADQCYGAEWTYYRSSRPGHLLAGLEAIADATLANAGAEQADNEALAAAPAGESAD